MTSSAMGLKLLVFGFFLPTTHAKTNAIQMRLRYLRAVRRFMRVYLHAKTAVDAGDIRTWRSTVILITGKKTKDPQFEPHAGIKWCRFWDRQCIEYRSNDVTKNLFWISGFWIPCMGGAWWKTSTAQIGWESVHGGPRYGRMNTYLAPLKSV